MYWGGRRGGGGCQGARIQGLLEGEGPTSAMTGSSSEYSSRASSFWMVCWRWAAWGVPIVSAGAAAADMTGGGRGRGGGQRVREREQRWPFAGERGCPASGRSGAIGALGRSRPPASAGLSLPCCHLSLPQPAQPSSQQMPVSLSLSLPSTRLSGWPLTLPLPPRSSTPTPSARASAPSSARPTSQPCPPPLLPPPLFSLAWLTSHPPDAPTQLRQAGP